MYKWYTVLIVLSVLILCACNSNGTTYNNDLMKMNLNGKVKSLTKLGYHVVEENGVMIKGNKYEGRFQEIYLFNKEGNVTETKQIESNGDLYNRHLFTYNTKGILIESEWHSEFGKETVSEYKYDNRENLIEWKINNVEGNRSQRYIYKYDDKANQIESNWYSTDSTLTIKSISVYDDKGNKIVENYFNSKGELDDKSTYKYDDKGDIIESKLYELNSNTVYKFKYEFDGIGNVIRTDKIKVNENDKLIRKSFETFTYDFNNNWIEHIVYENEIPELIEERIIEYYN